MNNIFDEVVSRLAPHADNLNRNIQIQGALVNSRLDSINKGVSDLGRPDIGSKWQRYDFATKGAETVEFSIPLIVPDNEIFLVQWLSLAKGEEGEIALENQQGNLLLATGAVTKEGKTVSVGGNVVFLGNEHVVVRAEKAVKGTLTLIRRQAPNLAVPAQSGPSGQMLSPTNTHDVARDVIESRTGQYVEPPGEEMDATGNPPAFAGSLDPTT
jgi:hypothetical protein